MPKPRYNQKINLTIQSLGNNGEGVGYWHGYTVFVDGALPFEVITARMTKIQKNYGRAKIESYVTTTYERIQPICPYFGSCGGCHLMHLPYDKQLLLKQEMVKKAFEKNNLADVLISPCSGSYLELGYRNKIQSPVRTKDNKLIFGFYERNSVDIIDIESCALHSPLSEGVFQKVKAILRKSKLQGYDCISCVGELRHVLVKSSFYNNEALVILVTNDEVKEDLFKIAEEIMKNCPEVKGVFQNINKENSNVVLGEEFRLISGKENIEEKICGLSFKISPASFFQVNILQAENLYRQALNFADLKGDEIALDAYCGVGTLSLCIAKQAKEVIGVESVAKAIEDARENGSLNSIDNVKFASADAAEFIKTLDRVDVAFLNPPRKGCGQDFLNTLVGLSPKKIIYISCNPMTLAKDLFFLKENGYIIDEVKPFDMFAQTCHVECVAKISKC
ncbi:MAG: 23S rRNA (uracil(1939)-C(5))-methyltransferase RlmD [Chlamydiae bacterium]|nr:23S rRNA (uracil(1939)-C(5))-methyltransferase RlmD [Chlamydiota bacterium]